MRTIKNYYKADKLDIGKARIGTSLTRCGVKIRSFGKPWSKARTATGEGMSFLPLSLAEGGCVTIAASCLKHNLLHAWNTVWAGGNSTSEYPILTIHVSLSLSHQYINVVLKGTATIKIRQSSNINYAFFFSPRINHIQHSSFRNDHHSLNTLRDWRRVRHIN